MPQARINALIVELANRFGHVVRLKGGDPFVFGRGYEELQHARAHGLQVTVVPGISSAGGLLTALEFPLTHRGLATSFTVLTATTRTGELSPELAAAATTEATLVILMGMHKLPEIARLFAQAGKADLPAAIVYAGSTPSQRIALCPAALLAETARTYELGSPAVLLIGEVVRLHPAYLGQPVLVPQLAPEWAVMLG
jgi:uroporphyrin-III C-methyltransferase